MRCRTDKTAAGPAGDEALLREWLEAVRGDIESAAPGDAVREHPSGGYAESAPVCHVVAGANGSGKTTFSGRGYLTWLGGLKKGGYRIHLYYVWVQDVGILHIPQSSCSPPILDHSDQYFWRRGSATFGIKPVSGTGGRPSPLRMSFSSSHANAARLLHVYS